VQPPHQSPQAWFAFIAWIFVALYIGRRHPNARGVAYVFLGGMMFLPEVLFIKLPGTPQIDKLRLTNLVLVLVVALLPAARKAPVRWWWYLVYACIPISQVVTALNNQESLVYGQDEWRFVIQGLTVKDGFYGAAVWWTGGALASYLGQRAFRTESDLETLLKVLACAGLVYVPLMLIEMRMSPQLHNWIYGYPANDAFDQSMRWGGYRPLVFMTHGLATALFILTPTVAAAAASRYRMTIWRFSAKNAMWIMLVTLLLAKSTAVWVYAAFAVPLARWGSPKLINRVAAVLLLITCAYPYLRATDSLPVDDMVAYMEEKFGAERADSMKFRFDNEDLLIAHAMKKPWVGWSTNRGRNMLYDDWGKLTTITDGGWIIALGDGGIFGLLLYYALPVLAMLTVLRRVRRIKDERTATLVSVLNLCVAIMWVDILPNGSFNQLAEFMSGALCSIAIALSSKKAPLKAKQKAPAKASGAPKAAPEPVDGEPLKPPVLVR
jgi:hypothetical protein